MDVLKTRAGWVLVAALLGVAAPARAALPWRYNLDDAIVEAQRGARPMLLEFWADWCAPCKEMEKAVYSRADVAETAARYVTVRINFDQKTNLVRKYNITEMPTLLIADSYGHELFRYSGYIGPQPFIDLLHSLPQDITEFNRLGKTLDREKNNYAALEGMARALHAADLFLTSNEYYLRALRTNEAKADASKREILMSAMGANYLAVKDGRQAVQTYEALLKAFPNSVHAAEWRLNLARAATLPR